MVVPVTAHIPFDIHVSEDVKCVKKKLQGLVRIKDVLHNRNIKLSIFINVFKDRGLNAHR